MKIFDGRSEASAEIAEVVALFEPEQLPGEVVFDFPGQTEEILKANQQLTEQQGLNPSLKNVGRIAVIDAKYSRDPSVGPRLREHLLTTVEVGNFQHRMWVTEPSVASSDPLVVISKPGLGEIIEDGIGFAFHRELAKQLPEAAIISHATHGVGPTAHRIPLRELPEHGLDQMAEQCLQLL